MLGNITRILTILWSLSASDLVTDVHSHSGIFFAHQAFCAVSLDRVAALQILSQARFPSIQILSDMKAKRTEEADLKGVFIFAASQNTGKVDRKKRREIG